MKPLNILVVEDNQEQIALLKHMIGKMVIPGEFLIMEDGEKAFHYLKNCDISRGQVIPDLILLDLNLPGQHGLQILHQMKETLGQKMPPVVIVSATIKAQDKADCYRAGAVCFLSKPYHEDFLNNVIVQLRMAGRLKAS